MDQFMTDDEECEDNECTGCGWCDAQQELHDEAIARMTSGYRGESFRSLDEECDEP